MEEEKIPTRADIPDSDKWDLTHLFSDVGKWNEDVEWITRIYPRIMEWKGRVGESPQTLAKVLEFEKQLDLKIERVYHFASLQLAEDSANNDYLARFGQLQNLMTKLAEASAFVVPEIQAIDDGHWQQFIADPALKDWKIVLHKIRRMRPHILSEREERLLAVDQCRHEIRGARRRRRPRETSHPKHLQFVPAETRSQPERARFQTILRRIPGSPIYSCIRS